MTIKKILIAAVLALCAWPAPGQIVEHWEKQAGGDFSIVLDEAEIARQQRENDGDLLVTYYVSGGTPDAARCDAATEYGILWRKTDVAPPVLYLCGSSGWVELGATGATGLTGVTGATGVTGHTGPAGGGSAPIFGAASDGDLLIDGDTVDLPSQVGVDAWEATTAYVVGDIVLSTGTNKRIWQAVRSGTSGGSDPFSDDGPGALSYGDFTSADGDVQWLSRTKVLDNTLEGDLFLDDLTVESGRTLLIAGSPGTNEHGHLIYAITATVAGHISADGQNGADSTDGLPFGARGYAAAYGESGGGGNGSDTTGADGAASGDSAACVGGGGGSGGASGANAGGFSGLLTELGGYEVSFPGSAVLSAVEFDRDRVPYYLCGGRGGGGGAGDDTEFGGGGGGGGIAQMAIGTLAISGSISADGGDGNVGSAGNAAGGGGGGGGFIKLVYGQKTGAGTITAAGGAAGAGVGTGDDGEAGADGLVLLIDVSP